MLCYAVTCPPDAGACLQSLARLFGFGTGLAMLSANVSARPQQSSPAAVLHLRLLLSVLLSLFTDRTVSNAPLPDAWLRDYQDPVVLPDSMAGYSAIGPEPNDTDPMSSSTGSLRGRRSDSDVELLEKGSANGSRRGRGKKDVGFLGQASWISSVINLVNTSTVRYLYVRFWKAK